MARLATPCTVIIQKQQFTVNFQMKSRMYEFTPFPRVTTMMDNMSCIRKKTETEVAEMLKNNKIAIISSILDEVKWPQVDKKV